MTLLFGCTNSEGNISTNTVHSVKYNNQVTDDTIISGASLSFISIPEKNTYNRYANFEFSGSSNVECSLNGKPFTKCDSPVFFPELDEGKNIFTIREH